MDGKIYKFEAVIEPVPDKGGAYVRFPFDIKKNLERDEQRYWRPSMAFHIAGAL